MLRDLGMSYIGIGEVVGRSETVVLRFLNPYSHAKQLASHKQSYRDRYRYRPDFAARERDRTRARMRAKRGSVIDDASEQMLFVGSVAPSEHPSHR